MNRSLKVALISIGVVIILLMIVPWFFQPAWVGRSYMGPGMMWPNYSGGFGMMFMMPLFSLLLLGLVVWAVVAAVRHYGVASGPKSDAAIEILKRRFANGEIGREEYEEKKRLLSS